MKTKHLIQLSCRFAIIVPFSLFTFSIYCTKPTISSVPCHKTPQREDFWEVSQVTLNSEECDISFPKKEILRRKHKFCKLRQFNTVIRPGIPTPPPHLHDLSTNYLDTKHFCGVISVFAARVLVHLE